MCSSFVRHKLDAVDTSTRDGDEAKTKYETEISKLKSELETERAKAQQTEAETQQKRGENAANQQALLDEVSCALEDESGCECRLILMRTHFPMP